MCNAHMNATAKDIYFYSVEKVWMREVAEEIKWKNIKRKNKLESITSNIAGIVATRFNIEGYKLQYI